MPATASTPGADGTAIANGNDGNIDSDYGHEACTYNSASAAVGNFWQVDLQSTNQIGRVNIYSRSDSNTTTLVRLSVLDGSSNVVYAATNDIGKADVLVENAPQYDIPIGLPAGVVGRYVKIETLLSEYLTFGEIEVFPSINSGMSSTPTNIVFSVSGGNTLHLTWPGSYLGWIAQSNSVSLANTNYWFDIAGSASVTNLNIPISPATPQVFYRLRLP